MFTSRRIIPRCARSMFCRPTFLHPSTESLITSREGFSAFLGKTTTGLIHKSQTYVSWSNRVMRLDAECIRKYPRGYTCSDRNGPAVLAPRNGAYVGARLLQSRRICSKNVMYSSDIAQATWICMKFLKERCEALRHRAHPAAAATCTCQPISVIVRNQVHGKDGTKTKVHLPVVSGLLASVLRPLG